MAQNQQITEHARRRELGAARGILEDLERRGIANDYTYSNAINAFVRCGEVGLARDTLARMCFCGYRPGVSAYTAYLKGLTDGVSTGGMVAAQAFVRQLAQHGGEPPNIRTANTFLRGCMLAGAMEEADWCLAQMRIVPSATVMGWHAVPDASTHEYMISMYSQALRVTEAHSLLQAMLDKSKAAAGGGGAGGAGGSKKRKGYEPAGGRQQQSQQQDEDVDGGDFPSHSIANACLCLAKAWAILGGRPQCLEYVRQSELALKAARKASVEEEDGGAGAGTAAGGGKRAWKSGDTARSASQATFSVHRLNNMARDLAEVKTYATKPRRSGGGSAGEVGGTVSLQQQPALPHTLPNTLPILLRTLLFRPSLSDTTPGTGAQASKRGAAGSTAGSAAASAMTTTLSSSYGLLPSLKRHCDTCAHVPPLSETDRAGLGSGLHESAHMVYERMKENFTNEGRINFSRLFEPMSGRGASGKDQGGSKQRVPFKLEICSGAGEWAVSQAEADAGKANWAALELRFDRCHSALCDAIFKEVHNFAVLGGDAVGVLSRHVASGSVDHLFVMHPEPPQQLGSNADTQSESAHLLTADFIRDMGRVLAPRGTLTIVTDSLWYGRLLLTIASTVCIEEKDGAGSSLSQAPGEGYGEEAVAEVIGGSGVHLFQGNPNEKTGVADQTASSYFHRLKAEEKAARNLQDKSARYFIVLVRDD